MKWLLGLFLLLTLGASPAQAFVAQPLPELAAQAHQDINGVFNGPDFNEQGSHGEWQRKHPSPPSSPSSPSWFARLLARLAPFLGQGAGYLLWIALGLLLIAVVWYVVRWGSLWRPAPIRVTSVRPVASVRQQTLEAEQPLPPDVAAAAEACWVQGDQRGALSLLYRGALTLLQWRSRLVLPDSATEQENLSRVRASQPPELVEGFTLIVRAWLAEAYAGQYPADFAQLLQVYQRHFAGSPP